jgi:uncharacterized protein (DUF433 family)
MISQLTVKGESRSTNSLIWQKSILVEVLQAYSSRVRHYETRFDKILEATNKLTTARKPRKPKAKSSAKIVHRLTAVDQTDITARYQQGWSSRRLAEVYGVSKTSIVVLLREAGVPIRCQGLGDCQADDIIERYANGASFAAISDEYGVSADTVRKLLLKQEIKLRSPWDRPRPRPLNHDAGLGCAACCERHWLPMREPHGRSR